MHDMAAAARPRVVGAGLCNACAFQRIVVSGRGSSFTLCRRAAEDPRMRRYPTLPVLVCPSFLEGDPNAAGPEDQAGG